MGGYALGGTIPTEFGKLTLMTYLSLTGLSDNAGTVPSEIGLLTILGMFLIIVQRSDTLSN